MGGYSGDNGPATGAALSGPRSVKVDPAGNIYVADEANQVIRKVSQVTGLISTVVGMPVGGYGGDDGPATSARMDVPSGIALDLAGNLYLADANNSVVRKVEVASGPALWFAPVPVGEASAPQDVAFENLGNGELIISSIALATLRGADVLFGAVRLDVVPSDARNVGVANLPEIVASARIATNGFCIRRRSDVCVIVFGARPVRTPIEGMREVPAT